MGGILEKAQGATVLNTVTLRLSVKTNQVACPHCQAPSRHKQHDPQNECQANFAPRGRPAGAVGRRGERTKGRPGVSRQGAPGRSRALRCYALFGLETVTGGVVPAIFSMICARAAVMLFCCPWSLD